MVHFVDEDEEQRLQEQRRRRREELEAERDLVDSQGGDS